MRSLLFALAMLVLHSVAAAPTAGASTDCRSDKTTQPILIAFTNGASHPVKIRGCQNQYGCKPYRDCVLQMPQGATESVAIDSTFKYFVFTYRGLPKDTELYPDANLHYPSAYTIKDPSSNMLTTESMAKEDNLVINHPSPGSHAHCSEISFVGGKNNAYYKAHGYQYQPPIWNNGPCAKKYNWFNRNTTIAPGVTETELGIHTSAPLTVQFAPELMMTTNTSHYEEPKPNGCQSDEKEVQVQGVKGNFCSPKCSSSGQCPVDVPEGVTAKPVCALKTTTGAQYCALVCSPTIDEASLRAGDSTCGKATCKAIQGVGICTYDD